MSPDELIARQQLPAFSPTSVKEAQILNMLNRRGSQAAQRESDLADYRGMSNRKPGDGR